ncbi:Odr-4 protein, partial [Globisporangium splendens]
MSRTRKTALDDALSGYWRQAVSARRRFELGLIIGQIATSSVAADALLTAVPVPAESDSEEVQQFEDISSDWVQEYAKQIDHLLPGGISIIGLYVLSADPSRSVFDQASFYLRAVAEALTLPEEFETIVGGAQQQPSVHYVVHICPNSSKTSAKSIVDILDATKSDASPVDLKSVPSTSFKLKPFAASVAFNEPIAFFPSSSSSEDSSAVETVMDEVQQQLQPLAQRVYDAVGIVKKAQFSSTSSENSDTVIQFLTPAATAEAPRTFEGGSPNATATHEAAIAFLKRDFVKSLLVRAEMICEKWADDAGTLSDAPFVFRDGGAVPFPKRGRIPWRTSLGDCVHFPALLYVLQEESANEAVQNALEILGGVHEAGGETSVAFLESDSQQQQQQQQQKKKIPSNADSSHSHKQSAATTTTNGVLKLAVPIVLVVLLAILVQLLMAKAEK